MAAGFSMAPRLVLKPEPTVAPPLRANPELSQYLCEVSANEIKMLDMYNFLSLTETLLSYTQKMSHVSVLQNDTIAKSQMMPAEHSNCGAILL